MFGKVAYRGVFCTVHVKNGNGKKEYSQSAIINKYILSNEGSQDSLTRRKSQETTAGKLLILIVSVP